jgi:hypothetical protein
LHPACRTWCFCRALMKGDTSAFRHRPPLIDRLRYDIYYLRYPYTLNPSISSLLLHHLPLLSLPPYHTISRPHSLTTNDTLALTRHYPPHQPTHSLYRHSHWTIHRRSTGISLYFSRLFLSLFWIHVPGMDYADGGI